MKAIGWVLVFLVASFPALAESIDAPVLKSGDTWVYRDTTEVGQGGWTQTRDQVVVVRVTSSSIYFTTRLDGSAQPPQEKSRRSTGAGCGVSTARKPW